VEEFCKYIVVKCFIFNTEHFDERLDGVVYMVVASMGFAGFENVMYILGSSNPTMTGIIRCVTSTPAHAIFSGFLGLFLGNAYICRKNQEYGKAWGQIILGFLIAVLLHGIYDICAFSQNPIILLGGILFFILIFGTILIIRVNALSKESKLELENKNKEN
jgi:RsiW-degrading membrane proteinase PrsW (M82 family)